MIMITATIAAMTAAAMMIYSTVLFEAGAGDSEASGAEVAVAPLEGFSVGCCVGSLPGVVMEVSPSSGMVKPLLTDHSA